MMRIDSRSVRFGIRLPLSRWHRIGIGQAGRLAGLVTLRAVVAKSLHPREIAIRPANSSNRYRLSWGPGPASGWYCTLKAGAPSTRIPSHTPSFRLTWVSSARPASESAATAKLWFWLVISTRPLESCWTGWLPPWWPKGSFTVSAPMARASNW